MHLLYTSPISTPPAIHCIHYCDATAIHRQYCTTNLFIIRKARVALRIYPLLESGLSYAEIQELVRTKHITNINLPDIANAKLVLGYDKAWLAGKDFRIGETTLE